MQIVIFHEVQKVALRLWFRTKERKTIFVEWSEMKCTLKLIHVHKSAGISKGLIYLSVFAFLNSLSPSRRPAQMTKRNQFDNLYGHLEQYKHIGDKMQVQFAINLLPKLRVSSAINREQLEAWKSFFWTLFCASTFLL